MNDFVDMCLGDFVALQRGHDLPAHERTEGSIPVMGSFGITGFHGQAKCEGLGVTIGRSGASIGVVSYIDRPFWPLNTCLYVVDFKRNDPLFTYYFLKTVNLSAHNSGSAQPSLNRNFIYPIPIAVPCPAEQQAIAATLGALDDKIELNRRVCATLEEMARALWRSWFVDFDPVHARARGEAPPHMPPATAALFPASFAQDGLPEGWTTGCVSDLVRFNPRESIKKGETAPYIDMKALPTSGPRSAAPILRPFTSGTKFRRGDTLLARITPCLENGKTALVDVIPAGTVGWGSTEFIVMRARENVPPALVYCLSRDAGFRENAIQSMIGSSGRQRVQQESVVQFPIALPGPHVLDAFASIVAPMFARITSAGNECDTLAALRDAVLPKLMSGEIRVREAERRIVEAVT